MKQPVKSNATLLMAILFIAVPTLMFVTGDTPGRTRLKQFLSLLTILAFSMMLAQVYLSRIRSFVTSGMKLPRIIGLHKALGYFFISVLMLHPVFIVLPRYTEAGAPPFDAFITMITEFDNIGIVLGLVAYTFMLLLGITSMFRAKLPITYHQWRVLHGILSILFIAAATWHAVSLGRHMDRMLAGYLIALAAIGVLLLLNMYFFQSKTKDARHG